MQQEERAVHQEREQSIGQPQWFFVVVRRKGKLLLEPHLISPNIVAYCQGLLLFNLRS